MALQDILSTNKNRAYPFVDDTDASVIPNWVLLDFRVVNTVASGSSDDSSVSCTAMDVTESDIVLAFKYSTSEKSYTFEVPVAYGSGISVCTVNVARGITATLAVFGGADGYCDNVAQGRHEGDRRIVKTRIIEIDGSSRVHSICGASGLIHIADGHNTDAQVVENVIRIAVGKGLGLGADCTAPEDVFDCSKALLFMNGQHADSSGNINIVGGKGVVVQTGRTAKVDGSIMPAITIRHDGTLEEML